MTIDSKTYDFIKEIKRDLACNETEAEKVLWQNLKNKKLGVKFRRQHVINSFVVDFVCLDKRLIIEVDGEIHEHQQERDLLRTEELEVLGYTVIRFSNEQVSTNIDFVLKQIIKKINQQETKTQTPPPPGEGGRLIVSEVALIRVCHRYFVYLLFSCVRFPLPAYRQK